MTSGHDPQQPEQGIGTRLRAAREAAGLSVSEVGQQLRMPIRVVQSLEAEDWGRLGAPVFVLGQLRSYARLLKLSPDLVTQLPGLATVELTELTPRSYTPKMQVVAEQAARRAVYIVLTLTILIPVWFATRSQQDPVARQSATLDGPSVQSERIDPAAPPTPPVRAAFTPIPARPTPPALSLRFEDDSWVEIRDPEGNVIESGLLGAGQRRDYAAGAVGRMTLGNANTVRVEYQGRVQDLTPYSRSNVARFTVSSDGSLTAPGAVAR